MTANVKIHLKLIKPETRFPWLYLLLAYGWAWLWTMPVALTKQDYRTSTFLFLAIFMAVFGPGLAAIILTYRLDDQQARRDYWHRVFDPRRIKWRWIVFMLLLWPGLHLFANGLSSVLGNEVPVSELLRDILYQPWLAPVIVILYFLQAFLEDLGWRGYMLEKVLKEWTPIKAALTVGIFHAFWHLPFFFIVGTNQISIGFGFNFWLFVAQAVAFSVFATWCYVANRHSTLAAILLHTVANLSNDVFNYQVGTMKFWLYTLLMVIGAIIVSLVWLRKEGKPMDTRYATSPDSTRIAFDVNGAGTPILLLHGGGSSRRDWHEAGYVARLQQQFMVITVDLRGHGESDKPTTPTNYSTEKLGQDILAVADACSLDRFILCGFSFGGNVSRYLAARSDCVSRLIMLGNRLGSGVSDEFRQSISEFHVRWTEVVAAASSPFDPKSLSTKDQEDIQHLSFPGELLPSVLAWSAAMLDWSTVIPQDIRCPALWLIGSEDHNAMESYHQCERGIPHSKVRVYILDGMNHEQVFDNKEQVLPRILSFLKQEQ